MLQAVVLAHRDEHFETNDVVHFDFNPSNILLENGQVSGVIDWEGACAGDCTFNLATLLSKQSCSKGQDISGSKDSWFPPERCYPVAGRNRTACVLLQKTSLKASP